MPGSNPTVGDRFTVVVSVSEMTRWISMVIIALLMLTCQPGLQINGECHFPHSWTGTWFQSGIRHPVKIEGNFMSSKGTCLESDGDKKFLIEDRTKETATSVVKRHERCFRCVVVYEKHENILQYKETFCDAWDTLERTCSRINGDAQLHSMFRVNASPISCPIRGPLTFSYNRGHGECGSPVSSVDVCSDDYRLLFRYQACPDIAGTESTTEELVCLATWREGSTKYFVGRMEHNRATSDEDRFRCFVYSKSRSTYFVAQSGDATCSGLISPSDGPKTMKLFVASYPPSTCQFPHWAVHGHRWHRLDGLKTYFFIRRNNQSFIIQDETKNIQEAHVRCLEESTGVGHGESRYVAQYTTRIIMGCNSGYACMRFVKRSSHVIEVQTGSLMRHPNEACDSPSFDRSKSEYTTLVTSAPERIRCPYKGQYVAPPIAAQLTTVTAHTSLHGGHHVTEITRSRTCSDTLTVRVGCASEGDIMEFQDDCMPEPKTEAFHCHVAWEENGTSYLIATLKGTKLRYCFIYAEVDNMVKFTSLRKSCKRDIQPGIGGTFSFNVTSQGQCDPDYNTSSSSLPRHRLGHMTWLWLLLWTACTVLVHRRQTITISASDR